MKTKKLFMVTLFQSEILITTSSNRITGFYGLINLPNRKQIKIIDKFGMEHDWIETKADALSYDEACGILKLFGVVPPTFDDLCSMLKLK